MHSFLRPGGRGGSLAPLLGRLLGAPSLAPSLVGTAGRGLLKSSPQAVTRGPRGVSAVM